MDEKMQEIAKLGEEFGREAKKRNMTGKLSYLIRAEYVTEDVKESLIRLAQMAECQVPFELIEETEVITKNYLTWVNGINKGMIE